MSVAIPIMAEEKYKLRTRPDERATTLNVRPLISKISLIVEYYGLCVAILYINVLVENSVVK
jgi:hypothetical protein